MMKINIIKVKLHLILFHPADVAVGKSIIFPVSFINPISCPKFVDFGIQFIPFVDVDEIFIIFSLILHEKSMNIPDDF